MSEIALSQLAEAEAQLSAQLTTLQAALSEIQEKRKGIQTVINMFAPSQAEEESAASTATASVALEEEIALSEPVSEPPPSKPKKASPQKTKTIRKDKRAAAWQRYIKDDLKETPLPDIVAGILKNEPKTVFKIAQMVEAIFKDSLPEKYFTAARNRVSNILSAGARDKEWYRGRAGTYSMTKKGLPT